MIGRRVFNIASAVSLVLLLAAALGVPGLQGDSAPAWITHGTMNVEHSLWYSGGVVRLENKDQLSPAQFAAAWNRLNAADHRNYTVEAVIVDGWVTQRKDYGVLKIGSGDLTMDLNSNSQRLPSNIICGSWSSLEFPIWFPLALLSILPLLWGCRMMVSRLRQPREGLCVTCSYDLTGNTSRVCPECGIAIAKT